MSLVFFHILLMFEHFLKQNVHILHLSKCWWLLSNFIWQTVVCRCEKDELDKHLESVALIVNSCEAYKGICTTQHDCIAAAADAAMYKHPCVKQRWFNGLS